jgi:hypothetical protein
MEWMIDRYLEEQDLWHELNEQDCEPGEDAPAQAVLINW